MLKYLDGNKNNFIKRLDTVLDQRKQNQQKQSLSVKKILTDVKNYGDKAVLKYENKFSIKKTNSKKIKYSDTEINGIIKSVSKDLKKSIDIAYSRIINFHSKQKFSAFKYKDNYNNYLSYKYSPIESVGVYVPGGTASYPSTVLMNCIPAIVAGVKKYTSLHRLLIHQLILQLYTQQKNVK